jgi:transposase
MATVNAHLSVQELEEFYVTSGDVTASRHFQVIWLLARGHTISQVSATTAFGERWIEQLLARYNADGPDALGDLRRSNGAPLTILKPELLAKLRDRLREPPQDGGLWSSGKVAAWMAEELGLVSVAAQRGWEALKAIGWSIQKPRKTQNQPQPRKRRRLKKARGRPCRRGREAPRQANRGLCDGRAPHRPEAGDATCVGTGWRASDRAWPSSFRLALRHRFRIARQRRNILVSFQWRLEAVL